MVATADIDNQQQQQGSPKRAKYSSTHASPPPPPPSFPSTTTTTATTTTASSSCQASSPPDDEHPQHHQDNEEDDDNNDDIGLCLAEAFAMGAPHPPPLSRLDKHGMRNHLLRFVLLQLVSEYGYVREAPDENLDDIITPSRAMNLALVSLAATSLRDKVVASQLPGGGDRLAEDKVWILWKKIVPWLDEAEFARLVAAACSSPRAASESP